MNYLSNLLILISLCISASAHGANEQLSISGAGASSGLNSEK